MEEKINRYVKGHMMTMMFVILCSFLFLFLGEFFLYRKIMNINKIVSEGFFQLKQENRPIPIPTPTVILKKK